MLHRFAAPLIRLTVISLALTSAVILAGCSDLQSVTAARDSAAEVRSAIEQRQSQLETLRTTASPDERDAIDRELALLTTQHRGLDEVLTHADAAIAEARDPQHPFTRTAEELSPLLPEPIRVPALLGAALAASLFRANQLKRAAGSIAQSIERVREQDAQFGERLASASETLKRVQTPTARRIVAETIKPGAMLKLPV